MTGKPQDFSILDPIVQSCPVDFYAAIHADAPVTFLPEIDAYMVCGYDELAGILRDTETFSSDIGDNYFQIQGQTGAALYKSVLEEKGWDHVKTLQRTDPPLHGHYRRLVDKVFTPKSVRDLTPRIEKVANDLIGNFMDRGACEFIAEFALPLPGIIIAEELGLDREHLLTFKRWADALLASATVPMDEPTLRETAETEVEMQHYLATLFAERRSNPRQDLLSRLVLAEDENGKGLSMPELQNIMHQLISGGFDTTTSAIAHGMWLLLRYPAEMAKLRANPALVMNFLDETLRFESPVQGLMRRTTRAVTVGGVDIPAQSNIITRYAAANQDPAKFPCPQKFDIERTNASAHLAFGHGPHFCVGRLLARKELEVAFRTILDRLDNIELARSQPEPPHHASLLLHALKELPILFERRRQS